MSKTKYYCLEIPINPDKFWGEVEYIEEQIGRVKANGEVNQDTLKSLEGISERMGAIADQLVDDNIIEHEQD